MKIHKDRTKVVIQESQSKNKMIDFCVKNIYIIIFLSHLFYLDDNDVCGKCNLN